MPDSAFHSRKPFPYSCRGAPSGLRRAGELSLCAVHSVHSDENHGTGRCPCPFFFVISSPPSLLCCVCSAVPVRRKKPAAEAPKQSKPAAAAKPAAAVVQVPESFLKKRKTAEEIRARRTEKIKAQKKVLLVAPPFACLARSTWCAGAQKNRVARKVIFKRAEKYVKEYREKENSLIRMKRQAKNNGNYFVHDEPKVAFVIRIRGCAPRVDV